VKTRSLIAYCLFFVTLATFGQTKHSVEFIGGMNYQGPGMSPTGEISNGITGGVGVSLFVNPWTEVVGTSLFTYFPPLETTNRFVPSPQFVPFPPYYPDEKQYSGDVTVGLRLHGQGSAFLHPFIAVDGGMRILRSVLSYDSYALAQNLSAKQFLNIHGTEDIHMLGLINVGGGLQIRPAESVWLNVEAKYQILIGSNSSVNTFIPVVVSVQLPV
jgi:hypothetical protein